MIHAAISGTGFMGVTHAEALKRLPGVKLLGIQGSTPDKSRAAADNLQLPKAYADFDEILADPEVAVVHLTTPNRLHYPQAKAALAAGKHVLCEKPLAMTSAESAELAELAAASGLAHGVNYNIRFYPLNLHAREQVAAGAAGTIHSITGSYQQDWLLHETDYNWRVLVEHGGPLRAVADIGTHWLDLVTSITGLEPEAVQARLHTVHPVRQRPEGEVQTYSGKLGAEQKLHPVEIDTEDMAILTILFRGGVLGSLFVSQVSPGFKNRLRYEIAGSKATLAWDSESPNELWTGRRDGPNETLLKDPAAMAPLAAAAADYPGGHNEGYPDTFKMGFRAFYDSIRDPSFKDDPPYATFASGHRENLFCDAVLKSHEEGRMVEL